MCSKRVMNTGFLGYDFFSTWPAFYSAFDSQFSGFIILVLDFGGMISFLADKKYAVLIVAN
jgi:hypothetical protein